MSSLHNAPLAQKVGSPFHFLAGGGWVGPFALKYQANGNVWPVFVCTTLHLLCEGRCYNMTDSSMTGFDVKMMRIK
jgi:hypothetical protein